MKLTATNLSKKYYRPTKNSSHFEAVKTVDFELEEGKLTEITGRSGSGKSTLLYMLAGLLKPSSGNVFLDGKDLYTLKDDELSFLRNEKFGVIPQGVTGLFSLTVLQNVLAPASIYRDTKKYEEKARELLELVGISELADSKMTELSGGELRRMAIARSLIMDPQIIFADEPTDDLDDENTKAVLELLQKTAHSGKSVLLVTHEASAADYADKIYRMDSGNFNLL
ncbi:ABC transporter ATP-binding protein [Treponema sp.]|uniref:ABC transporter ATP-binding protein n=1 Tax=Treponema sp. TaxID=166 RepID=UPI00388EF536